MKKLQYLVMAMLLCMLLVCAAGCKDAEFEKAAKQAPTVKYIAVDNKLNLMSNYIEERDLKSDGLDPNAYFLYGTESKIYFAVTSEDTRKTSTVYSYDIASRDVSTLFSQSGHDDRGSGKEFLFYIAMAKEDTVTCFYSYTKYKMFGDDEFYIRADDYDLKGNKLDSKEFSAYRVYGQFSNNKTIRDMIQFDYLAGKADYYWSKRSGSISVYTYHGLNGSYDVTDITSSDAMWNFIHSEREYTTIMTDGGTYFQTYKKNTAFSLQYIDNSQDKRYVYFHYTEGGEPKYLFSRNEKEPLLLGLYIV